MLAAHETLAALHAELSTKQRMLDQQSAQLEEMERANSSAEHRVCSQNNRLDEMVGEVA